MKLKTLIHNLDYLSITPDTDMDIQRVVSSSKEVEEGDMFVAIKGGRFDGSEFIAEAIERGAKAIVLAGDFKDNQYREFSKKGKSPVFIFVSNPRQALAKLSAEFYGYPSERLKAVGITGTNGKTTVSYLVQSILERAGFGVGLIGTVGYRLGDSLEGAGLTTPGSDNLQCLLHKMVEMKLEYAVLEVSSHSLEQFRVDNMDFNCAVFTNLTEEHLDYHLDMEGYFKAKAKLFQNLNAHAQAVINIDDPYGERLIDTFGDLSVNPEGGTYRKQAPLPAIGVSRRVDTFGNLSVNPEGAKYRKQAPLPAVGVSRRVDETSGRANVPRVVTYGIDKVACIGASDLDLSLDGSQFNVSTPRGKVSIRTPLIGRHNVYNILASIGVGLSEGLGLDVIKEGIESLRKVPGRLESVDRGQSFKVFVDYAHTEDALRKVLSTLRELPCLSFKKGKGKNQGLTVVFGCGGDRHKAKRKKMGEVAGELAERIILTNDNPRSEEPGKIISDIEEGLKGKGYSVILDRFAAIKEALIKAKEGETVLIAGKGHEDYQIFKERTIPFDDRKVAREILETI